ncbi:MAG TPA: Rieske 2Fe-2S domain-containing protein [Iamia sp.]|nr:Rieske 2Fe-2S domain-containing protein [Iamia sp.]
MTDTTDDVALGEVSTTEANGTNGGLPVGLPMPRDPELLFDMDRRQRVTTFVGDRYPFPVPNGWFVVAEATEIEPGEVRAIRYFDRDLVLYRAADGTPRTMDAHCPHLGAHLAVGGRVEGECIRCPFHGWKFQGEDGQCVEIPYGDVTRIPPKAHARSYPTIERNHMIWAWYHAQDGEPFYEVPEVPEFHDDDWTPIVVRDFHIRVAAQDMAENNVDFSHFRYVHGTEGIPEDEFVTEGTYKKAVGGGGTFVREGFGLGLGVLRVQDFVTFLSSTTPLDAGNVHVRWIFTSPRKNGEKMAQQAVESFCSGVSQDIPIWENKLYRNPPIITKTEKLILEHRRWSEQFYS